MKGALSILQYFRMRWLALLLLECITFAWMLTSVTGLILYAFDADAKESLPFVMFWVAGFWWFWYREGHRINLQAVAKYLDSHDQQLENSTTLLWKDAQDNLLEKLQKDKLIVLLEQQRKVWKVPVSLRHLIVYLVLGSMFFGASFYLKPTEQAIANPVLNILLADSSAVKTQKSIVLISRSTLQVLPPLYSKRPQQSLPIADLDVLENSELKWSISLSSEAEQLYIIFQIKDTVKLEAKSLNYNYRKAFSQSSFYQIMLKNESQIWLSDFYKINIYKDLPPQIVIKGLEERSEFDIELQTKVPFRTEIKDDFGISEAYIVATVSRGDGESVRFREEKLSFATQVNGQKNLYLDYSIDFESLQMEAGDELYFYIQAKDNRQPQSNMARSEMFFLSIKDTMNMATYVEGGLAVDLMPEYFRSQRQIIIDTEELLAERKSLDVKTFQARSNALANDQKILRLRYGQFLGEEFESNIGPNALENLKAHYLAQGESDKTETDSEVKKKVSKMFGLQLSEGHYVGDGHNHDDEALKEHDRVGNVSNPEMSGQQDALELLQPYIHAHDESEEASFFDEALKAKLKSALVQMWEAELRLRLYQPKDALPFEYHALKLIKEIQQDSRIYVERVGFEAPPLKEDKRLSGKWQQIAQQRETDFVEPEEIFKPVEDAILWANQKWLADSLLLTKSDQQQLNVVGAFVSKMAIEEPGKDYLKTLKIIKKLQAPDLSEKEIRINLLLLNQYLHAILGQPNAQPYLGTSLMFDIRQNYIQSLQRK